MRLNRDELNLKLLYFGRNTDFFDSVIWGLKWVDWNRRVTNRIIRSQETQSSSMRSNHVFHREKTRFGCSGLCHAVDAEQILKSFMLKDNWIIQ